MSDESAIIKIMQSSRGLLDRERLEFHCPECGHKLRTTVGNARRSRSIRCLGGHTVEIEGSGLDRTTREVERSIDGLMRKFR